MVRATDQTATRPPTVMLVDDHPLWRETLRKVIERQGAGRIVAEADDGETAIRTVADVAPDVVVMDVDLPGLDGVAATARIVDAVPGVKVLFLSAFDDRQKVLGAVEAGASGYLLKTARAHDIAAAVTRVTGGELVFPPDLAEVILTELRGRTDAGEREGLATRPPVPSTVVGTCRREGEFWTLEFEEEVVRIAHLNGLADLSRLLAVPGQEILAAELAGTRGGGAAGGRSADATTQEGLHVAIRGSAGPSLDAAAKRAYRGRIAELQSTIDEAERFGDTERESRAREELQLLGDELAGAVGLGGRDRPVASDVERARISVTRGLRRAIKRIDDAHPALGRHLDRSVRTGTFCCYDPEIDVRWELS